MRNDDTQSSRKQIHDADTNKRHVSGEEEAEYTEDTEDKFDIAISSRGKEQQKEHPFKKNSKKKLPSKKNSKKELTSKKSIAKKPSQEKKKLPSKKNIKKELTSKKSIAKKSSQEKSISKKPSRSQR